MGFCFVSIEGFEMNEAVVGFFNTGVGVERNGHIEDGASVEVAVWTYIGAAAGEANAEGSFTAVNHALGVLRQR